MALKITQIMLSKGMGGAERLFIDVSLALAARGCLVQAICHSSFSKKNELYHHKGIEVYEVSVSGNWDYIAVYKITKAIKMFNPDAIHSHLARSALYAGRAAARLQIPALANMHNYADLKYYRNIKHFFPGTEDQRSYLEGEGVGAECITVAPHFSLIPYVEGAGQEASKKPLIYVSYGRFVKKKGFDVLLRAFAKMVDDECNVQLYLGGDGPEKGALEEMIVTLGLTDKVFLTGWIDNVAEFLDKGTIFILPSRDEAFGIVMLEAMARGKAIISTKTKGPLAVLDSSMAELVDIGSDSDLYLSMKRLYDEPKKTQDMASLALSQFKNHYSADNIMPIYIECFQAVVKNNSASA